MEILLIEHDFHEKWTWTIFPTFFLQILKNNLKRHQEKNFKKCFKRGILVYSPKKRRDIRNFFEETINATDSKFYDFF